MDYIINVRMPDELLDRAERAAASLGMSADDYLRSALEEKVSRWYQDEEEHRMMKAAMESLFARRGEVYRRLAQWPAA